MSNPIWPVVAENLAEQIAATQSGSVYLTQLLPHLPMSIGLIESALDGMLCSRVAKERVDGLECYIFVDYLDRPPQPFLPLRCVYSDEPLEPEGRTALSQETRSQVEAELEALAKRDPWPSFAVWQHELVYLIGNLPKPVQLSSIAGHCRLPFKKTQERLIELQKRGAVRFDLDTATYSVAAMPYSKEAFRGNDAFIRKSPGASREEDELRLVKGLVGSFVILSLCILIAITGKFPFPILFLGGLMGSAVFIWKVFKAPPKPLPELN
ncbi:hypothetical protein [Pelagicoccus albus]|uniref:Uncharacterized protein n=1 Tax=Pelagicoccus albus TaxID=415222 RepID=A0A7X1B4J7_9BACT|nr:hypothetical protein [Pelagicoccus albus]MBC2605485.1 hypothetical protein [Pelagicoccus albus]